MWQFDVKCSFIDEETKKNMFFILRIHVKTDVEYNLLAYHNDEKSKFLQTLNNVISKHNECVNSQPKYII